MNKIIDTIFYWLFVIGLTGVFTYLIFWKGYSGWWYLMVLVLVGAAETENRKNKKEK